MQHLDRERIVRDLTPVCMDAAWELCRRGLVRPGVRNLGEQAVPETGYSLTVAGREVLADIDPANILVMQPGSLARTFSTFEKLFGDGFMQRASEAIRCRNAEAWLACCAMAGAAAESILLALAIAKTGDEPLVVRTYAQSGGRTHIPEPCDHGFPLARERQRDEPCKPGHDGRTFLTTIRTFLLTTNRVRSRRFASRSLRAFPEMIRRRSGTWRAAATVERRKASASGAASHDATRASPARPTLALAGATTITKRRLSALRPPLNGGE
jgi:hypothetical protein